MSNVTWQAQASLNQVIPKQVSSALNSLNEFLKEANGIISVIETIVTDLGFLFTSPIELLIAILKNFSGPITQVLTDALGLGGGFIIIHPWNRITKRYKQTSKNSFFPLRVPVMNAQEAFNELYASFSNTADPYRPQWGANDKVTGMGMLVVSPDPSSFLNIVAALQQVLDFKEFGDIIDKYTKDVISWYKDAKHQAGVDIASFAPFDIKGVSDLGFQNIVSSKGTLQSPIIFNSNLPSLHWFGLSLSNLTFLSQVANGIESLINKMLSLLETTDNAIGEFVKVLFKKLTSLQNLIQVIVNALSSFLISLQNTGLYFFEVPQGTGGVQYVITQLQQSLSHPTGDGVTVASHLTDSDFCLLFFMGASTGVDLNAWEALFKNAFDQTTAAAQALAAQATVNFTVIPDFHNKVFFFDKPIKLNVTSQDSSPTHQFYYTYKVTDEKGNVVSSFLNKVVGGNTLKVNNNPVTLTFSHPTLNPRIGTVRYTITIEIFDFFLIDTVYTATFTVTDQVSSLTSTLDSSNRALCVTANKQGTLSLGNSGYTVEKLPVASGKTVCVGTTVGPNVNGLTLTFDGADGTSFSTDVTNNLGFTVGNVFGLPIPSSFRFLTFPGKLCFQFEGALKYQAVGASSWTYVTLPSCILISGLGCYNYYVYTPATGWSGLLSFCIVQQATEGTQVC